MSQKFSRDIRGQCPWCQDLCFLCRCGMCMWVSTCGEGSCPLVGLILPLPGHFWPIQNPQLSEVSYYALKSVSSLNFLPRPRPTKAMENKAALNPLLPKLFLLSLSCPFLPGSCFLGCHFPLLLLPDPGLPRSLLYPFASQLDQLLRSDAHSCYTLPFPQAPSTQ